MMTISVGDLKAFPSHRAGLVGITYRQYLIGQALAGINSRGILTTHEAAITAVSLADTVIQLLDQEKSDHG